jgi:hypothetical protein
MTSPVQVLIRAAELGVKLGVEAPDTLTFEPVERCPEDFVETLRACKWRLLPLLQRNDFVLVDSHAVGELLFFCQDEYTKEALVEAGAEPWSVYARAELQILVAQNRVAPLSDDELRKLHDIKRTFGARIAE